MNNSPKRSAVMLMCGVSGSGKTYNALRLEAEGYVRLSLDKIIWERHGANIQDLNPEQQKDAFSKAQGELRDRLAHALREGTKVVVDATHCRRSKRDEMRELCRKSGVAPIFVFCDAPEEVLWERLNKRRGRNADDLIVTRDQLHTYFSGFDRPHPDESDILPCGCVI